MILSYSFVRSVPCKVDYSHDNGSDDNPKELEPVEERDAYKSWLQKVVKRRPEHGNERDDQQYKQPGASLFPSLSNHSFSPSVLHAKQLLQEPEMRTTSPLINMHAIKLQQLKSDFSILKMLCL